MAIVHMPLLLPPGHVAAVHGVPATTMARTVFDFAAVLHPGRTERALDSALARRLTTLRALRAVTEEMAGHGRAGSALMRQLLADRQGDYLAPESGLEARFASVVTAAGLAMPVRQRDIGGEEWIGRVDYLDQERDLVIEIDRDLHHRHPWPWAATTDENVGWARLSSFILGAVEPESQTDAWGLPGTTNCCPVHVS